jgi:ABC-type transporter Mla subunit MlaD
LQTAQDDDNSYSVKVTFQDGSVVFTTAQVMSYRTTVGSVDQITMATCVLEIDNDIVPGT